MGSVNLFSTGKSGLFANRTALSTTGHNIANVKTEGYSRQRVEQVASEPAHIGNASYGTGVMVKGINRINDGFLSRQITHESKYLGQYEEKDIALAQAETIFNEITNDGMNRLITKYFNEFRKLGNEPESEALRATVRESAQQLVGDFHRIARSIQDIQKNIDVRLEDNVRKANDLVERIAHLNEQIKKYELQGGEAGDLRDSRDKAVKDLSAILDVSLATNERGEFTISISGVGPLVSGQLFNKLYTEKRKAPQDSGFLDGSFDVKLQNLAQPLLTHRLTNGKMGGLIEARDVVLSEAAKRMDQLAFTLATKVNELHRQGFALNGSTGVNFFKQPTRVKDAAELMAIDDNILSDANNIATAIEPDAPGDNRLVQFISRLQHARLMEGGAATFDDFYNATVSNLATVSQRNRHVLEHQTHIINQLDKIRESISGVSLDEETTNLVQFQHAFDASAKVIKVADEILEEVLNLRR